jgi:hypothetical protein
MFQFVASLKLLHMAELYGFEERLKDQAMIWNDNAKMHTMMVLFSFCTSIISGKLVRNIKAPDADMHFTCELISRINKVHILN